MAQRYRRAHESYLARRHELGDVAEIEQVSAGGMPTRVKCLHVLVAHSLAAGPGREPARRRGVGAARTLGSVGSQCVPDQDGP